ncbi:hypothetical protein P2G88_12250 [Aliiglaciecola sp. CAU 1673]|uniref:hypothetical protein n=1 Tax=Aliiglaciecola sp. CAU 1673 TaxID=3032595 RepID=UPI0023D99071|nr:hypothetical protein [Aliiglaciecola sp. CAU 1673]MDF2179023.1 hypothetical protein [Aliiglaciecola sp. CAU 1673]
MLAEGYVSYSLCVKTLHTYSIQGLKRKDVPMGFGPGTEAPLWPVEYLCNTKKLSFADEAEQPIAIFVSSMCTESSDKEQQE